MLVEFFDALLPFDAPIVSDVILLLGQGTFRDSICMMALYTATLAEFFSELDAQIKERKIKLFSNEQRWTHRIKELSVIDNV